ncbi:hypothetical protein C0992_009464 [Termitomyces sp. T32_za158]|nr:hypothetical protein C0992_009464 [Termitomyces sp. T32_za158]
MSSYSIATKTTTLYQKPLYELIEQNIHVVVSFTLECGVVLRNAPIAYKTWGRLNATKDNVMVICHALTGSADVQDWWGPMMGRGKAFDPALFFIICLNVLGSPYGSASPLTLNPETGKPYGPEFPPTTIRDDVRIHKLVLDHLGVTSIATVIGGSMGGMHVLEWPLCTHPGYVRHIVPLATSVSHSAWCIAWSEAQRQALCADPTFNGGWYDEQPRAGLAAARVCAMLTYRSRTSFGLKFGRRKQIQKVPQPMPNNVEEVKKVKQDNQGMEALTPPPSPQVHTPNSTASTLIVSLTLTPDDVHTTSSNSNLTKPPFPCSATPAPVPATPVLHTQQYNPPTPVFCAQSYLRYQGQKFLARFDANCFIHITHKMDTHDISRGRPATSCTCVRPPSPASSSHSSTECDCVSSISSSSDVDLEGEADLDTRCALARLPPRALVIGISSDNLFVPTEQRVIAAYIPGASLVLLDSVDGHDGFLLEFEAINRHVIEFLRREEPGMYVGEASEGNIEGFEVRKTSVFGEAEVEGDSLER